MRTLHRLTVALFFPCILLLQSSKASAGGYDTPILYSARHMGVAGAAVGYVSDPSAIFHNPAGLAHIGRGSLLVDFSPLLGRIEASPADGAAVLESEVTFAPFFLVGGAGRITKWLVAGFAVYPVASAGAEYKQGAARNNTTLMFVEAAPGVAFNLPKNIRLGLTYRITYVKLDRFQGTDETPVLDFDMSGFSYRGFRAGAQWHYDFANQRLQLGAHYRHKTVTEVTNDEGIALRTPFRDIETKFTLPTRLTFGGRYDYNDVGVVLDAEYALQSQNKGSPLSGVPMGSDERVAIGNVFRWKNAWTVRSGVEYRLMQRRLPLRLGYAWDQQTSNPKWPTAFGTPPGPGHIVTCGGGWVAGPWQVNAAYAYRRSIGEVTQADIDAGNAQDPCAFCGGAGDYKLTMHGIYVDFSYEWR